MKKQGNGQLSSSQLLQLCAQGLMLSQASLPPLLRRSCDVREQSLRPDPFRASWSPCDFGRLLGVLCLASPVRASHDALHRIEHLEKAISIWETENFFFDLEPLPGAVEAVKQMANLESTDVFICTSPIKMYKYCPFEKYAWVEKHFGPDFLEQIVLTRDKTVVSADLLIDDRVDITGKWPAAGEGAGAEPNPSWEHVVFTACHNRHTQLQPPSRRLHSWADDWKAILDSKRPR
ncbi:5,3-nucleotidase, mitochondrial-like protein [Camelus ferus]|nr:5,3-nucleotidase, mitochondrial-like protein [Camelus ferus]